MKIYLICPVRRCTADQRAAMDCYVKHLEAQGHTVHYPPRDVDQSNDDGGVRICYEHREAMLQCDEVHTFWDNESTGSHFDLGMAYMLSVFRDIGFDTATGIDSVVEKSFQNVLVRLVHNSRISEMHESAVPPNLEQDSGDAFLRELSKIADEDIKGLRTAYQSYGPSWKSRGGVGAFMMLARKWDRMENRLKKLGGHRYDIFQGIATDDRGEGLIDDVRDLRRYLLLVESEMRARGFQRQHRDNAPKQEDRASRVHG